MFRLIFIYYTTSYIRHALQCHTRKLYGQVCKISSRSECKATLGTPASTMKGDGHVDSDFPLVSKVKCAKFHQHLYKISRLECRATQGTPASSQQ